MGGLLIAPCTQYVYFCSPFTSDGSVSSAVRAHAAAKMVHVIKYVSFLKKNNDIPYIVKKRMFDAALMSAVLYGCESWLNADLKPIIKLYNWSLKNLLGVRMTTCNDLCYLESGCSPLQSLVKSRQRRFFKQMWRERSHMQDDPLIFAINTVLDHRYTTRTYVSGLIGNYVDDISEAIETMKQNITESTSSRRVTYREINPSLSVHNIYSVKHNIKEHHRIAFTRFRLSSHSLAIEVGRWSRRGRGRLPVEERLCSCGAVQTETHVIQYCTLSQHIRTTHNFSTIYDLFSERFTDEEICNIIYSVLNLYS